MSAFEMHDLSFSYPGQANKALDSVSLTVEPGNFLVLCGPSGCGKSTLLRQLKTVMAPHGERLGTILFEGQPLDSVNHRTQSQRIGFVQQSPEDQLVTDKVWHELAFGLESLGYDTPTIRRRVAEMASFFGIQTWFYKDVTELSGGQKQLLNLASVMVLQPSVLVLDEPTSQLDPIAASDFLAALGKINRELGTTILLTEHRLEEAFAYADRVAVLDEGRLLTVGTPTEVGRQLKAAGHGMFLAMPAAMQVWAAVANDLPCPVTVRDGKDWLDAFAATHSLGEVPDEAIPPASDNVVLSAKELWFRYQRDGADVVKGLSLEVRQGEFLALLGGNGAGKTTSLKLLSGLRKPYRGKLHRAGSVGVLPQDPQTVFVKDSVREDLFQVLSVSPLSKPEKETRVGRMARLCRLDGLLDRHPYDLSGGEQQRAALAKVLLLEPDLLFLDEPTKGLDAEFKEIFAQILQTLIDQGVTLVMVSHDIEFCARYAHRCALFFDGAVVTEGTPRVFFSGNAFYTTSANRMARRVLPQAVTVEDVITACGGKLAPPPELPEPPHSVPPPEPEWAAPPPVTPKRNRLSRRTMAATLLILLLIPLTLFLGEMYLEGNKYSLLSLLVLIETMLPFFLAFEGRKPQAREIVLIAVLCAIGVAGRAALFMVPNFKPVIALTILVGIALGSETGFLVGSMTMLVSNMLLSQGPWTPWQMFATGIIGFLAGALFQHGLLPKRKGALCVFGGLSTLLIYGGIMNPASALMWTHTLSWEILVPYFIAGFPMDCVHTAATVVFLWVAAEAFLVKLERVNVKYGLIGA